MPLSKNDQTNLTMTSEVEQDWEILERTTWVTRIWELSRWVAELVEEWVHHGISSGKTLGWRVFEQAGDEVNGIRVCLAEDFVEWVWLDLWKLVLHVVGVHGADLIPGWSAKHLDNFDKLINSGLSREQRLSEHKLSHHTTSGPDIDLGGVVGGAEDKLWCSVVSGADVGHVWLVLDQDLCRPEVTELENAGCWVQQQVLWLNIAVADALRVDVGESAEKLVNVELDLKDWHGGLHLVEISRRAVDGLWNEFLDQVEVNLVLLVGVSACQHIAALWVLTRSPLE